MQSFGLELLMLMDQQAEDARREQLPYVPAPQETDGQAGLEPPSVDSDPAEDAERDFDYSEVDWAPDASADEWTRMQAALAASRVEVDRPADGEPDQPDLPAVDFDQGFDREWT